MFYNFLKETKGGLNVLLVSLVTPLLAFSMGAVQTTSYAGFMTRLHQSQCAALTFVSLQGVISYEDKMKLVAKWMDSNLILSDGEKIEDEVTEDGQSKTPSTFLELFSMYKPKTFVGELLGNVFVEKSIPYQEVNVKKIYFPIEIVFTYDMSGSMDSGEIGGLRQGMIKGIENLFEDENISDTIRVSIIPSASEILMPAKYARKMVKPSSRQIDGTDPQRKEKLEEILRYYGLNDLLDYNYNAGFEYVYLQRKPMETGKTMLTQLNTLKITEQELITFVNNIDAKIVDLERDGFELGVLDGRQFRCSGPALANICGDANMVALSISSKQMIQNNCTKRGICNWRRFYFVSPELIIDGQPNLTNVKNDQFIYLGSYGSTYRPPDDPILVGSNNKAEIIKFINDIGTLSGNFTGHDEQLLWSFRLLSPNYSDIWDIDDNYPAPYHSNTEKKIIFLTSGPMTGYSMMSGVTTGRQTAFFKYVCTAIRDKGIGVYTIGEGPYNNTKAGYQMFRAIIDYCAGGPESEYAIAWDYTSINTVTKFKEVLRRKYAVRLVEKVL